MRLFVRCVQKVYKISLWTDLITRQFFTTVLKPQWIFPNSDSSRHICLSKQWARFPCQSDMVGFGWYFLFPALKTSLLLPFSPKAWHITPNWKQSWYKLQQVGGMFPQNSFELKKKKSCHSRWSPHVGEGSHFRPNVHPLTVPVGSLSNII